MRETLLALCAYGSGVVRKLRQVGLEARPPARRPWSLASWVARVPRPLG